MSEWDCPPTSWVERSVLVFSNLFYLLPAIHCLYALCNRSKHFPEPLDSADIKYDTEHLELDIHKNNGASASSDVDYIKLKGSDNGCNRCDRCVCKCKCGVCGDKDEMCDGTKWMSAILMLLPEFATSLSLMVISTLYHMCSDGRRCTRLCLDQWDTLYKADFTTAFQLMCVAFLYTRSVSRNMIIWKWSSLGICLVLNILFANYVLDPPQQNQPWFTIGQYYGIVAALCVALVLFRIGVQGRQVVWKEVKEFRKHYVLIAIMCAITGIYFQLAARSPTDPSGLPSYWWMHACWHIFTALATFFRFLTIPT